MDVGVQGDDPRPLREHDPLTRLTSPGLELRRNAESGATRTPIPVQGGQHSGDCGQRVMMA